MSTEDEALSSERSHHVAMTIRAIVCGISDLERISPNDIDQHDAFDLRLAYGVLRQQLERLTEKRAA